LKVEDLKAYIETGILELYVLGDVTPDEKRKVEEMASKHPEIKAELDAVERSMELYAQENAVEPSENLRGRILASTLTNLGDDRNFSKAHPQQENNTDNEEEDNVITLPAQKQESSFYKYAFAASFALLIASTIALVNVYSKLQSSNEELVALQADKQHFANQVKLMDNELSVYRDTTYKLIRLKGTAKTPGSALTVAFSPVRKRVIINMANMKMPVNDNAHQYQLWALVGGKPVNLGVFDSRADTLTQIKEMKSLASADAFAVTLEPRGGSVNPTMDQMMVIGKF
jgi:anti-sigma-K factor RskA